MRALCLPGYSSVNGRCLPCPSINYGALIGVLSVAFLLVFAVHRLQYDWTGAATLFVVANFLQLSVLFLASESLPQLLSLVNFNLLGDHISHGRETGEADGGSGDYSAPGVCVMPLSDSQRLEMQLLSPLLALLLLASIGGLHFLARMAVAHSGDGASTSSRRLRRVYGWLCVPSPSRISPQLPLDSEGIEQSDAGVAHDRSSSRNEGRVVMYQRSVVRLVQLSYTGLAHVTFAFFHLQDVGEFGWRVVDYPSLSPSSPQYVALFPLLVLLMIFVVFGLPLLLLVYLFTQSRNGRIEQVKHQQRLIAVQSQPLSPSLSSPLLMQTADDSETSDGSSGQLGWRDALLLQLTAMHRLSCWWMACFVLFRRLVLVALLTWMRGPSVWIWLSLANAVFLALHVSLEPYERRRDNSLETLTLLSLLVQTTLLSQWPPPYLSLGLVGTFNALIVGPLLPVILGWMMQGGRLVQRIWRMLRSQGRAGDENHHAPPAGGSGVEMD